MKHEVETRAIARERDGGEITLTVHRLVGGPGPTVTVVGVQHGDEWFEIQMLHALLQEAKGWEFNGTLVIVPVANPTGLRDLTRISQPSSDEADMNRHWPSGRTWISSLAIQALTETVIDHSDVVIDYHMGLWGSSWAGVCYSDNYPDATVSKRSRELAFTYGANCVQRTEMKGTGKTAGSLTDYAGVKLGVPSIVIEIGGAGWDEADETEWIRSTIRGTRNVLIAMGMAKGELDLPERVLDAPSAVSAFPRNGGLLLPVNAREKLLRHVEAGEVLARVICPQRLTEVEEIKAPVSGWLFCIARSYMVRPGDWAFSVLPEGGASWNEDVRKEVSASI